MMNTSMTNCCDYSNNITTLTTSSYDFNSSIQYLNYGNSRPIFTDISRNCRISLINNQVIIEYNNTVNNYEVIKDNMQNIPNYKEYDEVMFYDELLKLPTPIKFNIKEENEGIMLYNDYLNIYACAKNIKEAELSMYEQFEALWELFVYTDDSLLDEKGKKLKQYLLSVRNI